MIKTEFKNNVKKAPKVSFVLLDWKCRESFHSLDYLADQDVPRHDYEIIWIEYYAHRSKEIGDKISDYKGKGRPAPIDLWVIMNMPDNLYYHKHLMYNIGIAKSRGDIVIICDSDAMFTKSFVRTVIGNFERTPEIALHFDEVRNSKQDFYPFNYPPFELLTGDGAINWRDGKTTGLWDTEDPLHSRNYGACLCARRSDLIAIGGADEHMDYLGHVCGPYELTFRLVNKGLKEVWHESEFLYHTWHPGSDGDFNYIGPTDGRHMSSTALEALETGRIMPLTENPVIRHERENGVPPANGQFIDPACLTAWTQEEVAKSPRFKLFKRGQGGTKLVRELATYNILSYDGKFYGVPHSLGPVDLARKEDREKPQIVEGASADEIEALLAGGSSPAPVAALPMQQPSQLSRRRGVQAPPVLVGMVGPFNVVSYDDAYFGVPTSLGPVDLADPAQRALPEILKASTWSDVESMIRAQRLIRLEVESRAREQVLEQLRAELAAKDAMIADFLDTITALRGESQSWNEERERLRREVFSLQFRLNGAELLDSFTPTDIAERRADGIRVTADKPAGCFLHGSRLSLGKGKYTLDIWGARQHTSAAGLPVLNVELISNGTTTVGTFNTEHFAETATLVSLVFQLNDAPTDAGHEFEIRLTHYGRVDLIVSRVRLRLTSDTSAASPAGLHRQHA